jgi:hypothetical protein
VPSNGTDTNLPFILNQPTAMNFSNNELDAQLNQNGQQEQWLAAWDSSSDQRSWRNFSPLARALARRAAQRAGRPFSAA